MILKIKIFFFYYNDLKENGFLTKKQAFFSAWYFYKKALKNLETYSFLIKEINN